MPTAVEMTRFPELTVVIPALNEGATIETIITGCQKYTDDVVVVAVRIPPPVGETGG